ncbi:MAG: hypothetical protein KJO58_06870, partial [Gammaproteobacteria bacterium]|nr:hypothetical protein [Gammaproteobacteria bacterium]
EEERTVSSKLTNRTALIVGLLCAIEAIAPHLLLDCCARLKQSHRTSMCSLRCTVHPEHNRYSRIAVRD